MSNDGGFSGQEDGPKAGDYIKADEVDSGSQDEPGSQGADFPGMLESAVTTSFSQQPNPPADIQPFIEGARMIDRKLSSFSPSVNVKVSSGLSLLAAFACDYLNKKS
jgi:hypothetical protein